MHPMGRKLETLICSPRHHELLPAFRGSATAPSAEGSTSSVRRYRNEAVNTSFRDADASSTPNPMTNWLGRI